MIHLPEVPAHIRSLGAEDGQIADELSEGRFVSPSDCPTCRGKGSFRWYVRESVEWWAKPDPRPDHKLTAEYECLHSPTELPSQWILYRNLLSINIGLHYQRLSLSDFASNNSEVAVRYILALKNYHAAGVGLVLHGDKGTGKTLTAVLVAKAAFFLGFSVHFTSFAEMVSKYSREYSWRNESRQTYYRRKIESSDFLVIDELGREARMGYKADIANEALMSIDLVIRKRLERCLPTVVTTNLTQEEVSDTYGSNVVSLFSAADIHRFTGSDWRGENKKRALLEATNGLTRPIVLMPLSLSEVNR